MSKLETGIFIGLLLLGWLAVMVIITVVSALLGCNVIGCE